MKTLYGPFILLSLVYFFSTCKKSGDGAINIQGFTAVDYAGNIITHIGPADQDWTFMTDLSRVEMDLFNFGDEVSLENTLPASPLSNVVAYPNPAQTVQQYHFYLKDSAVVKAVLVDASLHVIWKGVVKMKGGMSFQLDISDRAKFPNRSSWRVYYSLSAKDHLNFKAGYGDIRICDGTSVPDCF